MNLLSRLDSRELGNYYCKMSSLKGGFSELFTPLTKKVTFNYVVFILLLYGDLLFWEKKF